MGMTPVAIVLSVITMGCLAPIQQPPPAVYAVLTEGDKSFVLHTQSLEFTVLNVGRSKHVTATNLVVFKSDRLKGPALAAEVAGIPTRPFLPIAIAGDARGARWTFASQILQSLHASLPPWSSYETYTRAWAHSLNVPFEDVHVERARRPGAGHRDRRAQRLRPRPAVHHVHSIPGPRLLPHRGARPRAARSRTAAATW